MEKENLKRFFDPSETAQAVLEQGIKKTSISAIKMTVLGILAGAFIAFAAEASNAAIYGITKPGLPKTLAGALFAAGLMLVIIAGGELFTGNSLIIVSVLAKKTKITGLLKNWFFVYLGNFLGSLLIAGLIYYSGQLNFSDGMLGAFTIKNAVYKTGLDFDNAVVMGILCNWLVCLAVWMAMAARDIAGKILAIFFPIWLFITSGFEHSIANMYYIPAGIFAKSNPELVNKAIELGVSEQGLSGLNWSTMFTSNLLPVTLGNIIGGVIFVGTAYWFVYVRTGKKR